MHQSYLECLNSPNPESKVFDFELADFADWNEVLQAYNPNLSLASSPDLDLINAILDSDPFFPAGSQKRADMETALMNYCTTMSTANPATGTIPGVTCSCPTVFCYINDNLV